MAQPQFAALLPSVKTSDTRQKKTTMTFQIRANLAALTFEVHSQSENSIDILAPLFLNVFIDQVG